MTRQIYDSDEQQFLSIKVLNIMLCSLNGINVPLKCTYNINFIVSQKCDMIDPLFAFLEEL